MRDSQQQFTKTTVILHWIVAISIIGLVSVGIYMSETESYGLYDIHKSFGILIFAVILVRVVWRVMNGWPEPAGDYAHWEHNLAKIVHWVLIVSTVLMPISGMVFSAASGHDLAIFSLEILGDNVDPNNADEVIPRHELIGNVAHNVHGIVGYVLVVAILLHIAGAIKHHAIDKDGTLRRMLGKRI